LKNEGVDFDIIGLSYYPYHHGPLANLNNALNILETNFDKDIMIVETGYYHAYYPTTGVKYPKSTFPSWPDTETGQLQFTKDLIEQLNNHTKVKGLYWWFLEANEYGLDWNTKRVTDDWYNASLFDNSTGKAMSAIAELKSFLGDPSGIETINREPLTVNQHAWYTLDGRKLNGAPNQRGIYIHNGKKMVVR
jgi:arabinogalactan endo-1,4-beta-galactosidase